MPLSSKEAFLISTSSYGAMSSSLSVGRHLRSHRLSLISFVDGPAVRISRSNVAYDLAERYRDFRSLVILSNDAAIGSPQRVQFYIEKYKEDFAFSLYSWYLEQGRLFDLMNQDTLYWELLSKFLEKSGVKRLSWMQNIAMNKYSVASSDLLEEAGKETRLAEQKVKYTPMSNQNKLRSRSSASSCFR
jgi:nuclear pore complex protein Nup133